MNIFKRLENWRQRRVHKRAVDRNIEELNDMLGGDWYYVCGYRYADSLSTRICNVYTTNETIYPL